MLTHEYAHRPGVFDPAGCRSCAREAGLLDYHHRVQHEERRLAEAQELVQRAYRYARWGLGSSGVGVLLAVVALLSS